MRRICGQCKKREPDIQFALGNKYTCKECGGRAYGFARKGGKRKSRSIWTVSGGLPTLGKKR